MHNDLLIKYAIGAVLALICVSVSLSMRWLLRSKKHHTPHLLLHVFQMIAASLFIVVLATYAQMAVVDFDVSIITVSMINYISAVLIALVLMDKLFRLVNLIEKNQTHKGANRTSARMVTRVFKITIAFVLLLVFGERLGLSLSSLMAFGGIGGIAIAMASKDVLSNLFSGIMLYFDRPFNIGDWVSSPDRQIEGTVLEIGWRHTKIMTFDHRPLYIPNSVFSSISVENPGQMTNRRIKTTLGLRYEDAAKIDVIIQDIKSMLLAHPAIDTKQTLLVNFNEFADSSLNIMVYCFTKTTVWAEWLDQQQDVYLKMIAIVQKHGADFAYPSQTIYIEKS